MNEWHLFLYYCCYCKDHDAPGKTYKDFFEDRELVVMVLKSYLHFLTHWK